MPLFPWSDRYRIGIAIFDAEHMRLVAMANEAYDAALSEAPDLALKEIFLGLIDYTLNHFVHEERFFVEAGYPHDGEHKAHHAELRRQVEDLRALYETVPKQLLAVELAKFLKAWIENHILKEDLKYGLYLNAKGVY